MLSWRWVARFAVVACVPHGCYFAHRPEAREASQRDAGVDASPARARDAGFDAGWPDAGPRAARPDTGPPREVICEDPQGVDLLLVIDDSGSLRTREAQVRDRMQRMLHRLLRPLDLDHDGWEDWPRVEDLRLGVVSTSAQGPPFCAHALDGRLMRGEPGPYAYCTADSYGPVLEYREGQSVDRFVLDTACVAFGPRDGCQVEQPLEAMAKALLPHDAPFEFPVGEPRGDTDNVGFLRDDSVLVVVIITDEDDQSVADPSIFDFPDAGWPDGGVDGGWDAGRLFPPGPRGAPWGLHPPDRYSSALRWLRPGHPERIVFAAIVGISAPLVTDVSSGDFGGWGCREFPGRIVDVARDLPAQSILGSVCDLSEMEAVHAIADRIAAAACPE